MRVLMCSICLAGAVAATAFNITCRGATVANAETPIDRHALVARHNIDWPVVDGQIPLGNGNFAFNADGTGLETVGGNTMSHWCWHHFPLPAGVTWDDIKPWATPDHGHLQRMTTKPPEAIYAWQRLNPQPLNLGRIGFIDADGERLTAADVHVNGRHLYLWTGVLVTRFTYLGQPVNVETCVDPKSDTVVVIATSPLLAQGKLRVLLDFPAPARGDDAWVGDFHHVAGHETKVLPTAVDRFALDRTIDDAHYQVLLAGGCAVHRAPDRKLKIISARFGAAAAWIDVTSKVSADVQDGGIAESVSTRSFGVDPAPRLHKNLGITYALDGIVHSTTVDEGKTWSLASGLSTHRFFITPKDAGATLRFTCHFGPSAATDPSTTVAEAKSRCEASWPAFWNSGGAIDLSLSKDPRWIELERRIVLSQYELAVQSAGDYPPAEVGLTGHDPWEGKWHFEMIWWHLAHYALWDRWSMADKALGIYRHVAPVARAIAKNFDYQGLMWPKSTGPDGYNDGYPPEMALLWRIPHPIFFGELDYRLHPSPATLDKWRDVIFGTADFMADYSTKDPSGQYNLTPTWPASEGGPFRKNSVFDLGYWRVALEMAQQWRLRLKLPREPKWDDVLTHLAPLPVKDGLYLFDPDRLDTYTKRRFDHIDIISDFAMLPAFPGLDATVAHNTLMEVARDWQWDGCWGWDFPMMAMAAARMGEPKIAIDALFNRSRKNHYDERGLCTGGPPPYLPGNGGLLYAVAMMAAGWDHGPTTHAPGFPADGSWTVRYEGLKVAP